MCREKDASRSWVVVAWRVARYSSRLVSLLRLGTSRGIHGISNASGCRNRRCFLAAITTSSKTRVGAPLVRHQGACRCYVGSRNQCSATHILNMKRGRTRLGGSLSPGRGGEVWEKARRDGTARPLILATNTDQTRISPEFPHRSLLPPTSPPCTKIVSTKRTGAGGGGTSRDPSLSTQPKQLPTFRGSPTDLRDDSPAKQLKSIGSVLPF